MSGGLLVHAPDVSAHAGDLVRLVGKVKEKYGQTQLTLAISDIASCVSGSNVTPIGVTLPVTDARAWSIYKRMLMCLP